MLEKGWRCLDCTVCEGCGKATDEGRLLLCDDCDISYHIYCLTPPLDQVPKGNWKCKWCVKCIKCGSRTSGGYNLEWKNNYTECGLCHSLSECPQCDQAYKEAELLLKCSHCDRWSHANCKSQLNEEEVEKMAKKGYACLRCQEEINQIASRASISEQQNKQTSPENSQETNDNNATMNIMSKYDALKFIDEINLLSKRGILDEGTYLTELGSELLKTLKIKPAPMRRNRLAKTSAIIGSNNPSTNSFTNMSDVNCSNEMNKNEEASRSSEDEKNEMSKEFEDSATKKPQQQQQKRQVMIGIGGFNPKARIRAKINIDENCNENSTESVSKASNKRQKKKSVYEEMIPAYMQEAFFGTKTLTKSKEATNSATFNLDENDLTYELSNKIKLKEQNSLWYAQHDGIIRSDDHKINLDENMLKSAQQSKKANLELGIEDFLDGDIVSYLFNDNRNLIDFDRSDTDSTNVTANATGGTSTASNSGVHRINKRASDEDKMFEDERLYEDIFHQIVHSSTNEDRAISAHVPVSTANSSASIPVISSSTLSSLQPMTSSVASSSSMQQQQQHSSTYTQQHTNNNQCYQQRNEINKCDNNKLNDSKNIDDLARQFKESTNKYAVVNSNNNILLKPSINQMDQFINKPSSISASASTTSTVMPDNNSNPNTIYQINLIERIEEKYQINSNELLNKHHQSQHLPNQQNSQILLEKIQKPQPNQQPVHLLYPNVPVIGHYTNSNAPISSNDLTANYIISPSTVLTPSAQTQPINLVESDLVNSQKVNSSQINTYNDENSKMSKENDSDVDESEQIVGGSTSASTGGKVQANRDQKKLVEKFAEDELLGEYASQAIPLFSNSTYPNLRNEIPDINERYKHIQKLWRKLDSNSKMMFVNKSRQNRYKKKNEQKTTINNTIKVVSSASATNSNSILAQSNTNKPLISPVSTSIHERENVSLSPQIIESKYEQSNESSATSGLVRILAVSQPQADKLNIKNEQQNQFIQSQSNMTLNVNPSQIVTVVDAVTGSSGFLQTQSHAQQNNGGNSGQILVYQLKRPVDSNVDSSNISLGGHIIESTHSNSIDTQLVRLSKATLANNDVKLVSSILNKNINEQQIPIQQATVMMTNWPNAIVTKSNNLNEQGSQSGQNVQQSNQRHSVFLSDMGLINISNKSTEQINQIVEKNIPKILLTQSILPDYQQNQNLNKAGNSNELKLMIDANNNNGGIGNNRTGINSEVKSNFKQDGCEFINAIAESYSVHSTKSSSSVSDHVDNIINQVASGLGTIPYNSDAEEDETSSSSFRDFLENQLIGFESNDSQPHSSGLTNNSIYGADSSKSNTSMSLASSNTNTTNTINRNSSSKPNKRKRTSSIKINKHLNSIANNNLLPVQVLPSPSSSNVLQFSLTSSAPTSVNLDEASREQTNNQESMSTTSTNSKSRAKRKKVNNEKSEPPVITSDENLKKIFDNVVFARRSVDEPSSLTANEISVSTLSETKTNDSDKSNVLSTISTPKVSIVDSMITRPSDQSKLEKESINNSSDLLKSSEILETIQLVTPHNFYQSSQEESNQLTHSLISAENANNENNNNRVNNIRTTNAFNLKSLIDNSAHTNSPIEYNYIQSLLNNANDSGNESIETGAQTHQTVNNHQQYKLVFRDDNLKKTLAMTNIELNANVNDLLTDNSMTYEIGLGGSSSSKRNYFLNKNALLNENEGNNSTLASINQMIYSPSSSAMNANVSNNFVLHKSILSPSSSVNAHLATSDSLDKFVQLDGTYDECVSSEHPSSHHQSQQQQQNSRAISLQNSTASVITVSHSLPSTSALASASISSSIGNSYADIQSAACETPTKSLILQQSPQLINNTSGSSGHHNGAQYSMLTQSQQPISKNHTQTGSQNSKFSSAVVLNRELLATYGVHLNDSQPLVVQLTSNSIGDKLKQQSSLPQSLTTSTSSSKSHSAYQSNSYSSVGNQAISQSTTSSQSQTHKVALQSNELTNGIAESNTNSSSELNNPKNQNQYSSSIELIRQTSNTSTSSNSNGSSYVSSSKHTSKANSIKNLINLKMDELKSIDASNSIGSVKSSPSSSSISLSPDVCIDSNKESSGYKNLIPANDVVNRNELITSEPNKAFILNNNYASSATLQQSTASPAAIANFNSDNTLLKALLQTAPKNAIELNQQQPISLTNETSIGSVLVATNNELKAEPIIFENGIQFQTNVTNDSLNVVNPTTSDSSAQTNTSNSVGAHLKKAKKGVEKQQQTHNENSKDFLAQTTVSVKSDGEVGAAQLTAAKTQRKRKTNTNKTNSQKLNAIGESKTITSASGSTIASLATPMLVDIPLNSSNSNSNNSYSLSATSAAAFNSNELNAYKLYEKFKSLSVAQMIQPIVNAQNSATLNYPGKQHSNVLKKISLLAGNYLNVTVVNNENKFSSNKNLSIMSGEADLLSYLGLEDSSTKKSKDSLTNNRLLKELRNCFKVCNSSIEKPPSLPDDDKYTLYADSRKRLLSLLESKDNSKATETKDFISEAHINSEISKESNNIKLTKVEEYLLKKFAHKASNNLINHELDSDNELLSQEGSRLLKSIKKETQEQNISTEQSNIDFEMAPSPAIGLFSNSDSAQMMEVENTANSSVSSNNNNNLVPITIKLSQKACKNIKITLAKLSELLNICYPASFDMGRLIVKEEKPNELVLADIEMVDEASLNQSKNNLILIQQEQLTTSLHRHSTGKSSNIEISSSLTMQNLIGHYSFNYCKFCESSLVDLNRSNRKVVPDNENGKHVQFCSNYCKFSYEKLLALQRKLNIKKNFQANLQQNKNLNCKISADANSNFIEANEIIETNSSNADKKSKRKSNELSEQQQQPDKKLYMRWTHNVSQGIFSVSPFKKSISIENMNSSNVGIGNSADGSVQNKFEVLKLSNAIDKRVCVFCQQTGDLESNGPSRLLAMDLDKWSHLNCALWSNEVYETMNGSLVNVDVAYKKSINTECCFCHHKGASLKCFSNKCNSYYHLPCALKDKCIFYQDKVNFSVLFNAFHLNTFIYLFKISEFLLSKSFWQVK
jgi:hypothetical protein